MKRKNIKRLNRNIVAYILCVFMAMNLTACSFLPDGLLEKKEDSNTIAVEPPVITINNDQGNYKRAEIEEPEETDETDEVQAVEQEYIYDDVNKIYSKETKSPDEVVLRFVGDVCFYDDFSLMSEFRNSGSDIDNSIDAPLLTLMRDADIFMLNNEFCYSDRGAPIEGKKYAFRSKPSNVTILNEMGADIVVSHHPHVVMNYELFSNKAIFYSLGNFIFDTDYQRAQFNTEKGLLLKLNFTSEDYSFEPMGIRIERDTHHVVKGEIPKIFKDVQGDQYELLAPLAAKMFIAATKRQQIYLNPSEYKDASEEKWKEHFANPRRSGRVEGEGLDFFIVCPLAEKEKEKAWKKSNLEEVKEYILEQM